MKDWHYRKIVAGGAVVSGRSDFVLRDGEVFRFDGEASVPETIRRHSVPVDRDLCGPVTAFDRALYDRATAPRPEPLSEPKPLTRDEVLALMAWTDDQLRLAIANLGFPRPGGYLTSGAPVWDPSLVQRYREAASSMPAPTPGKGLSSWLR